MSDEMQFNPDWVSPPGETIEDILESRRLDMGEFASRLKVSIENVRHLISGESRISESLADKLGKFLGPSSAFWIKREQIYRQDLERLQLEAPSALSLWLKELPVKEMIRFRWIKPMNAERSIVQECLKFFDVPNVATWRKNYVSPIEQAAFRTTKTFISDGAAVAAWLRQGEVMSKSFICDNWNLGRFQNTLLEIRHLTRIADPATFVPELQRACAQAGVAVAILQAPRGCKASGATRFISAKRASILLSCRYLSDDHFWFTFFHEAGHLILHERKLFLEGLGSSNENAEEEANNFSAQLLVPREFWQQTDLSRLNAKLIIRLARSIGVSPGILVGQMQHKGLVPRSHYNSLKRRYIWKTED